MRLHSIGAALAALMLAFGVTGCSHLPGKPGFRPETMRPDQTHDFAILYKSNCSACHGNQGMNGAALPLNNPVYLQWAGHDRMVRIAAGGVAHSSMPAFSQGGGGFLTDRQIEDIVNGMISHWGKQGILSGASVPGYSPTSKDDIAQGKAAFQVYCSRCHGVDAKGIPAGSAAASSQDHPVIGSIVDPTYLSLISSQGLRDIVVSGMPGEGMPDWRGDVVGKPMTDNDVTNIVAWLGSHRTEFPGQPFPSSGKP